MGRHPCDHLWPAFGAVRGREPARPAGDRDRSGHRGACFPRHLDVFGRPDRAVADQEPEAAAARRRSARARAALPAHVAAPAHDHAARDRRGRHGTLGHRRQGREPAAARAHGQLPRERSGLRLLAGAGFARGLRRAGAAVQGSRLDRVQDPSADGARGGHPGLRGGPQGGRRRLPGHVRWQLELPLRPGAQGRPRARGARLLLVRGPARRERSLRLHAGCAQKLDIPILATEYTPGRLHRLRALDPERGRPTICAATSRSRAASPRA